MQVFVSYASKDRPLARKVAEMFRSRGASVWIDEGEMSPGDNLADKLASAIQAIDVFVVILTERSVASAWVNHELRIALARMVEDHVQLILLRFDDSEMPTALRGLIWGDCRTEQGLFAPVSLALREQGLERPLSPDVVQDRFIERAPIEYALRLLPTDDFRIDGGLGADEREYVFVGDYAEQAGRSLRQIQSNLWVGDAFDPVQSANLRWTAIVLEVGELNRRKLDLMPGTWKAVFRILSAKNRLDLFDPTDEERVQLGPPPRDYYAGDQGYWYSQITSRRATGIGKRDHAVSGHRPPNTPWPPLPLL